LARNPARERLHIRRLDIAEYEAIEGRRHPAGREGVNRGILPQFFGRCPGPDRRENPCRPARSTDLAFAWAPSRS
jgi:hypothetical protein